VQREPVSTKIFERYRWWVALRPWREAMSQEPKANARIS
jgi:hypothetical protein